MAKSKAKKQEAEAPKSEAPAKKEVSLTKTKVWACNLYIRDHGHVWEGEVCTADALSKLKNADQYVQ